MDETEPGCSRRVGGLVVLLAESRQKSYPHGV